MSKNTVFDEKAQNTQLTTFSRMYKVEDGFEGQKHSKKLLAKRRHVRGEKVKSLHKVDNHLPLCMTSIRE